MEKSVLGRTGFAVSRVGLGTWQLGSGAYGAVEEREAHAIVDEYVKCGGNFIDTARSYLASEERIGKAIRNLGVRKDVLLCSKSTALNQERIWADLEMSLRNLQTDYLDVFYVHSPPGKESAMNDVLDIFLRLKEQGLIRAIGASIKGPNVTSQTTALCRQYIQSGKCDVLQVIFSMARQRNRQVFEEAGAAGVGLVARSSLESGFLTGKFSSNRKLSTTDHRRRWHGQSFQMLLGRVSSLENMLKSDGLLNELDLPSMTHLALRYAYEEPYVSAIIPGASSVAQVRSNCSVSGLPDLDQKVRRAIQDTFEESTTSFNLQDHATIKSRLKTMLARVKRKLSRAEF